MSHTDTQIQPVPVEITNAELLAGAGKARHRHRVKTLFRTYVLTAANPMMPVAAEDLSRVKSYAQAAGNSVLLCESQSQAQDPANSIANAFANPQGTLLYVNAGATGLGPGLGVSSVWALHTNDVVWAVAIAFPAFLYVTWNSEAHGY